MKKKNIILSLSAVVLFILLFFAVQRLLCPKYAETLVEGGMIEEYYSSPKDHDVIFVGDCEVYANFSPLDMYEEYGAVSYIRGTSQQLMWQSYYIIEETLRYEIPEVIVLNVNALRYSEPVKEEYNRLCIDRMKWSKSKIGIIKASMTEEESFISYVFPILRYHSRYGNLTGEDFRYFFGGKENTFCGHLVNNEVLPVSSLPTKRALPDYTFAENTMEWLDRITALCKENGVSLVLIKAPSLYPYWYDEYDAQVVAYAEKNGLKYYNLYEKRDEIGIDYSTDTYDGGYHLNTAGAKKLSSYFGNILVNELGIPDRRNEPGIADHYDGLLEKYKEAIGQKE